MNLRPTAAAIVLALCAIGAFTRAVTLTAAQTVTGSWGGSGSDAQGSENLTWQLTQSGNTVTGTAVLVGTGTGTCGSCHKNKQHGTLSGTVSGNTLTYTISFPSGGAGDPTPICSLTWNGSIADITQSSASGTYTGTDTCEGSFSDGTLSMVLTAAPVTIQTPPANQTIDAGGTAQFTVVAAGTPAPTYQWQLSVDAGASWSNLSNAPPYSGATTSTLVVTNPPTTLSGARYRVLATNSSGTVTSSAAVLSITVVTSPVPAPAPAPAPPPPPTPTAFPPSVSPIANQTIAPGSSASVSFTVTGAVDADQIAVGVSAYNAALLPLTAFRLTHAAGGNWTLTITAPPARTGATVVEVIADDGYQFVGRAFVVTIAAAPPAPQPTPPPTTRPTDLVATATGSGIALTWIAPTSAPPSRYVIAGGSSADRVTLPVIVTPGAETRYTIPSVPRGGYAFRVYAVTSDGLSAASEPASVAADGAADATGPPTGLTATTDQSTITLAWTAPLSGARPTSFQVEAGGAPGGAELGLILTTVPRLSGALDPGRYFLRVRAVNGSAISAPSNEVSVTIASAACTAPPRAPLLLPASISGGNVSLSWLPGPGAAADYYRIDALPPAGDPITVLTPGTGTSLAGPLGAGTYKVRATAVNACGASAASVEITFTV